VLVAADAHSADMAWCAPDRCSPLGVSFCACRVRSGTSGDTTSVTPARSRHPPAV